LAGRPYLMANDRTQPLAPVSGSLQQAIGSDSESEQTPRIYGLCALRKVEGYRKHGAEPAGIAGLHPHPLRHWAVSLLSAAGFPLESVADVAGDATSAIDEGSTGIRRCRRSTLMRAASKPCSEPASGSSRIATRTLVAPDPKCSRSSCHHARQACAPRARSGPRGCAKCVPAMEEHVAGHWVRFTSRQRLSAEQWSVVEDYANFPSAVLAVYAARSVAPLAPVVSPQSRVVAMFTRHVAIGVDPEALYTSAMVERVSISGCRARLTLELSYPGGRRLHYGSSWVRPFDRTGFREDPGAASERAGR
jgi:hypothetical protein